VLFPTSRDNNEIALVIQKGLDVISEGSKEYDIPISVGKNEALLFTNLVHSVCAISLWIRWWRGLVRCDLYELPGPGSVRGSRNMEN
jgi:hypothetical protein